MARPDVCATSDRASQLTCGTPASTVAAFIALPCMTVCAVIVRQVAGIVVLAVTVGPTRRPLNRVRTVRDDHDASGFAAGAAGLRDARAFAVTFAGFVVTRVTVWATLRPVREANSAVSALTSAASYACP